MRRSLFSVLIAGLMAGHSGLAPARADNSLGLSPLHRAAQGNDAAEVRRLLAEGAKVDAIDRSGEQAVHTAAGYHQRSYQISEVGDCVRLGDARIDYPAEEGSDVIDALVAAGARIDKLSGADGRGAPPIFHAATRGEVPALRTLIAAGASVEAIGWNAMRPIDFAAGQCDNVAMVETLLYAGADPNGRWAGGTTLSEALSHWDFRTAKLLVQWGADLNATTLQGDTALHLAINDVNREAVQFLLARGADLEKANARRQKPLHLAMATGDKAIIDLLEQSVASRPPMPSLEYFALGNRFAAPAGIAPSPPLLQAVRAGDLARVKELVGVGVRLDQTNRFGLSAIHLAAQLKQPNILVALLAAGAKVDWRDGAGWTPLHHAANVGDLESVGLLLGAGADPNAVDKNSRRPIHLAAIRPSPGVVDRLIAAKADLNAIDDEGRTPLLRAAMAGRVANALAIVAGGGGIGVGLNILSQKKDVEAIKLLADMGVRGDADAPNADGVTPLYAAVAEKNRKLAEALLAAGADCNSPIAPRGRPLAAAIVERQIDMIDLLLAKGCDPNGADANTASVLLRAIEGPPEIWRRLLAAGANPNVFDSGESPLMRAASLGRLDAVKALLDAGAKVDARNGNGETAILIAIEKGKIELAELLLARGARLDDPARPIQLLKISVDKGDRASVKFLIAHGARVDPRGPENWQPIHRAAQRGDAEMARLLLDAGASVEAQLDDGARPLHLAARGNQASVVEMLLRRGVEVDTRDKAGWSALHCAARNGATQTLGQLLAAHAPVTAVGLRGETTLHVGAYAKANDVAEALIKAGASLGARDIFGRTVMHSAICRGASEELNLKLVETLLEQGAPADVPDKRDVRPVQLAQKRGYPTIVKRLLEAGAASP